MSDFITLLRGHGLLLVFLGSICLIFGWTVAVLEWDRQPKETPTASWSVAAVASMVSLFGAALLLRVVLLRLVWGSAVLAMSIAVMAVVCTSIIGSLVLAPIDSN